ncbi:redox-regulated ATPase YchF [Candidatus Aerophobetes bacterium]|nr:redox-regulated ATPase YchF [Candidatus Aerophobetes bacterium]
MASLAGGIIGLPNAGKSTIFNALTGGEAAVASYCFCTISPNVGITIVPDARLQKLAEIIQPEIITPAAVEIVDVAGLIKGAHKGEGLGNEFLSRIRGVDVLIHVVRCFEEDIPHPEGSVDPVRDVEIIKTELFLSDLEIITRRLTRLNKLLKSHPKYDEKFVDTLSRAKKALEEGVYPEKYLSVEECSLIKEEGLLTLKPVVYVVNIQEEDIESPSPSLKRFREFAEKEGFSPIEVCGKLEMELMQLPREEREKFAEEMGIGESATGRIAKEVFDKLSLISFFTITGGKEVRAWAVRKGTLAVEAAGKVHSDMQRGFIKAEVIPFEEFLKIGSFRRAKEEGKVRIEGKDYNIKDGDIIHFQFAP